jgi:sulfur carrier protein ThiS
MLVKTVIKNKEAMSAILEKAQSESTEQQLKMIQLAELIEHLDINRFEYITEDGREVVSYAKHTFQLQDDLRTLKVFREKK